MDSFANMLPSLLEMLERQFQENRELEREILVHLSELAPRDGREEDQGK